MNFGCSVWTLLVSCALRLLDYLVFKYLDMSVPDEVYFRIASFALNIDLNLGTEVSEPSQESE